MHTVFKKVLGDPQAKTIKRLRKRVAQVNALAGNAPACGSPSSEFAAACAVIAGSMRLKSCSVSALEVAAVWAACATAGRTTHNTLATASSMSSVMAERAPPFRIVRSEESMIGVRKVPADLRDTVFVRGFSTEGEVPGGRGIGLPLVRLICSQRGGEVVVDDAAAGGGGGAEFRIVLPLARPVGQDGRP